MSVHPNSLSSQKRLSHLDLLNMRRNNEKISMLTCYDASFASLLDACKVDVLLVGDSLGMVVQGHLSTLPVKMDAMIYHTEAVCRGSHRALIISDMPFGSFQISPQDSFRNAAALMVAGAQMVKIEGGIEMVETTNFLSRRGIPVCAHIGLLPQSVNHLGGYRVQGRDAESVARLRSEALALQEAGACMLLMEAIPAALAASITDDLTIPTIGIGAGAEVSGQVLVLHDMLNISLGKKARFVKNYMDGASSIEDAILCFISEVKAGKFPALEHTYK